MKRLILLTALIVSTSCTSGQAQSSQAQVSKAERPPQVSTTPGGSDGSIQFNDLGTFNGSNRLHWDNAQNMLTINGGTLNMSGSIIKGVLYPESDNGYDIGSETLSWASLYLGADQVLYFGNTPVLYQGVGGQNTKIDAPQSRAVEIMKPLVLRNLPTFNPGLPGHVWNDNGVLRISSVN